MEGEQKKTVTFFTVNPFHQQEANHKGAVVILKKFYLWDPEKVIDDFFSRDSEFGLHEMNESNESKSITS